MICYLVIVFNVLFVCSSISGASTSSSKYYLRWIGKEPILPIYIENRLLDKASTTVDHRWFKYPQEVYVDEIDNYESKYLYSQQEDKTVLYILDYSLSTHRELGTYEPRPIVEGEEDEESLLNDSQTKRDLYTLVYLKSHTIDKIDDVANDRLHFFCNVSVLMPNIKRLNLNKANLQLIEKSVNLKMGFFSPSKNTKSSADSPSKDQHKKTMRIIAPMRSRSKRNTETDSFIQINLDIGPMTILKSQLNLYANARERNLTCKLSLVEIDTGNDLESFVSEPIVDSEVKWNNLLLNGLPPAAATTRVATTTTSKARKSGNKKSNSTSSLPRSRDLKSLLFLILILVVHFKG